MLTLFSLASFVEVVAYGQLAAFTPLHLPRVGVAAEAVPAWVGAITAGSSAFGLLFLPFWGVLADRYGRKPLIIRSFVATGAGLAVAALAPSIWLFTFARAITALNLGNSGLMMTTLTENAPGARLGFAFGVLNGAGPLGAFVGPLAGGPLVDRFGFGAVLALDAAMLAAIVALLTFGYRDGFRPSPPAVSIGRSALDGLGLIWHSPRLRALFPALLVLFSGWMLTFIYVPLVVARIYDGPDVATAVGIVLGSSALVTLIASPGIGALADRFGHWRVLYAAGAVNAALWLLPWAAREYVPFILAWALVNGIGSGVFSLSFNLLSASATEATRARVMTFAYLPLNLGFVLGPGLGGFVASADVFLIFPTALVLGFSGLAAVAYAARRPIAA